MSLRIHICRVAFYAALLVGLVTSTEFAHAQSTSSAAVHDSVEVEARVREFFADIPVMIEIARCESKFRQYTDGGSVLRGGLGSAMLGVFQIYEPIHINDAAILGFNINTLEGNLGYARHLYNISGTNPWNSSYVCWKNTPTTSAVPKKNQLTAEERAHLLAQLNELMKLIAQLQQLLALRLA